MKPWIKITIGVIFGFCSGFGAGFLFHKKLNDVEFEEITEEEMAAIEKEAQKLDPVKEEALAASRAHVESVQDLPEDPDKMRINLQGKVSYIQADHEAKEKYFQLHETVKEYSDEANADEFPIEENFDEEFLEMIENEEVEPGQVAPPHIISLADFYNERNDYDKITIDWYEPDKFIDERNEEIANIETYVGMIDIQKLFDRNTDEDDPDIRFIRNEEYQTDYEIVRHHRPYTTNAGGSE